MYHYKNRTYHAELGVFMQADPIGHSGGVNLYAYVGGDPINFSDPMGLSRMARCYTLLYHYRITDEDATDEHGNKGFKTQKIGETRLCLRSNGNDTITRTGPDSKVDGEKSKSLDEQEFCDPVLMDMANRFAATSWFAGTAAGFANTAAFAALAIPYAQPAAPVLGQWGARLSSMSIGMDISAEYTYAQARGERFGGRVQAIIAASEVIFRRQMDRLGGPVWRAITGAEDAASVMGFLSGLALPPLPTMQSCPQ